MSVHEPLGVTPQSGTVEFEPQALGSRTAAPTRLRVAGSRQRVGLFALSGLLVTGLLVSISASHTAQLLPQSATPIPRWLAGVFGGASIDLRSYGVVAVLVAMFACYAVAVHAADRLSARAVLMSIAGLYAIVLLAPPLVSMDVFSYGAYGRMGTLYGANPYLHGPIAIPSVDPLYPFIGAKW